MDARKPPYGCCMVLTAVTSKDLLTCTSISVPSALRMCASYGALESTLVSTRSTVPDTLATASARTLDATSPVNAVSVLPLSVCLPAPGPCWLATAGVADGEDDEVPGEAALAI